MQSYQRISTISFSWHIGNYSKFSSSAQRKDFRGSGRERAINSKMLFYTSRNYLIRSSIFHRFFWQFCDQTLTRALRVIVAHATRARISRSVARGLINFESRVHPLEIGKEASGACCARFLHATSTRFNWAATDITDASITLPLDRPVLSPFARRIRRRSNFRRRVYVRSH